MVIPDLGHEGKSATRVTFPLLALLTQFTNTLFLQAVDFVQITFLRNGEFMDVMQYKFELLAR
jgi:hypothetical protein